jgi:hypothetical protein
MKKTSGVTTCHSDWKIDMMFKTARFIENHKN